MMPITYFLGLLALVIVAAGASLALVFWLKLPLLAVAILALSASLALGARQWR